MPSSDDARLIEELQQTILRLEERSETQRQAILLRDDVLFDLGFDPLDFLDAAT
jgi:hypothetical protein